MVPYLEGSDVGLVLVSAPSEVGSDLASLVPDAAHHGLSGLVPEGDELVGVLSRHSHQGLAQGLHLLLGGPRVSGTEVGPVVQGDADHGARRQLDAVGALAVGGSALQLPHDDHHVVQLATGLLEHLAIAREAGDLSLVVDEP